MYMNAKMSIWNEALIDLLTTINSKVAGLSFPSTSNEPIVKSICKSRPGSIATRSAGREIHYHQHITISRAPMAPFTRSQAPSPTSTTVRAADGKNLKHSSFTKTTDRSRTNKHRRYRKLATRRGRSLFTNLNHANIIPYPTMVLRSGRVLRDRTEMRRVLRGRWPMLLRGKQVLRRTLRAREADLGLR